MTAQLLHGTILLKGGDIVIYKYYSWAEYVNATNELIEEGLSLVSPGYFKKYGLTRQRLFNWATEFNFIRQYNCYFGNTKQADVVLIPVEDVISVLKNKGVDFDKKEKKKK